MIGLIFTSSVLQLVLFNIQGTKNKSLWLRLGTFVGYRTYLLLGTVLAIV